MAIRKKGLTLKEAVKLLSNQKFLADSRQYWADYRAHSEKIGNELTEWEHQAPAFLSAHLDPFARKWGGAYPATEELLSSPLYQERNAAQMSGRWGIIPVYTWTTRTDVLSQLKQIQ